MNGTNANGASSVPDVLKHLSLHINPGETVAVVGPTGAGKTTLVSLISRFYDVPREKGAILVDGYDIRDVTRSSLAGQMSMVLQEPFLFSGTVRDNIKYNHPGASDEHMIEACEGGRRPRHHHATGRRVRHLPRGAGLEPEPWSATAAELRKGDCRGPAHI